MAARKATTAQIEEALFKNYGNVSAAARAIGLAHPTVWNRIKRSERLQKARLLAREETLDLAESALIAAVKKGEAWAVCFLLKTIGKERGYTERQEVTGKDGGDLVIQIQRARERVKR